MALVDEKENLRYGFEELEKEINDILKNVENIQDILTEGAKEYVNDLSRLPRPYSKLKRIRSSHMLDVMGYRKADNNEVEVGAGVYWLRFVELGTQPSSKRKWSTPSNPFMRRTWDKNKEKYYKKMINKIH